MRATRAWWLGVLVLAGASAILLLGRDSLDKAHVALVYLLVVLGGSALGGRSVGVFLALASFVLFDVLFLPPYNTLVVADPLDWLVLIAFLATGIVAAQLLARAQRETDRAQQRAAEVDRLASLGADTLSAPRAEDALAAIARVIAETVHVERCDVYPMPLSSNPQRAIPSGAPPQSLVQWAAHENRAAWILEDGTTRTARDGGDAPPLSLESGAPRVREALYPLRVRDVVVGVLQLADANGVSLDPTRQRYLDALSHYAALGVERFRLAIEAEHAAALREADRIKDALLAAVSHDLRTPLTTIRGIAHDIVRDGDDRGATIEEEAIRLNALVADLLDLSRVAAGGMPFDIALNTADDLMGAALQRVGGHTASREIRASIDPADPLLVGRFDLGQSLRVLGNLLENALKYAPADTVIDFTVRRRGDWLEFDVADRGPGVPTDERERIFEPFHRAPGTPTDVSGTGLGLAIARGLAVAQHGSLTALPRDGGGSVFRYAVPAAELPVE